MLFGIDILEKQINEFYGVEETQEDEKEEEIIQVVQQQIDHELDDQATILRKDDLAFLDKFVIRKDSTWKGIFDFIMMITACFNVFGNAYFAAFGVPTKPWEIFVDKFIESMFFADMCFCFC